MASAILLLKDKDGPKENENENQDDPDRAGRRFRRLRAELLRQEHGRGRGQVRQRRLPQRSR